MYNGDILIMSGFPAKLFLKSKMSMFLPSFNASPCESSNSYVLF